MTYSNDAMEPGAIYRVAVARHENVGEIGVPCLGCNEDIGVADYLSLQSPSPHGMMLLHVDCAVLLSEDIDNALTRASLPLPPELRA